MKVQQTGLLGHQSLDSCEFTQRPLQRQVGPWFLTLLETHSDMVSSVYTASAKCTDPGFDFTHTRRRGKEFLQFLCGCSELSCSGPASSCHVQLSIHSPPGPDPKVFLGHHV